MKNKAFWVSVSVKVEARHHDEANSKVLKDLRSRYSDVGEIGVEECDEEEE